MKRIIIFLVVSSLLLVVRNIIAQTPQSMNYQAIARDAAGKILATQNICVQSTIMDGNGGTILYQETFSTTTNQFGLLTLKIGMGTPVSGTFSGISWSSVNAWQRIEIKIGCTGTYVTMGSSQLLSVPYALNAQSTSGGWNITGNSETTVGTNYLGTNDEQPLMFKVNNQKAGYIDYISPYNTGFGYGTLLANTSGAQNTANGWSALNANTTGNYNVANGTSALYTNTLGSSNIALGNGALYSNTTASDNTAIGYGALVTQSYDPGNIWSSNNVAVGYEALFFNQPTSINNGISNTAIGNYALYNNTEGFSNTANGYRALFTNISGTFNSATGQGALYQNTTGSGNTANGHDALVKNITGAGNTADGESALHSNTTGNSNTANGSGALYSNITGNSATAIGNSAMYYSNNTDISFENNNVAVGFQALMGSPDASANTGNFNTTTGYQSLFSNTSGNQNTATGTHALYFNTSGPGNTADGVDALHHNTEGFYNTANGLEALPSNTTGDGNTAIGVNALFNNVGGNFNTAIGFSSGTDPASPNVSNSMGIGNNGYLNAFTNRAYIGNLSTSWIGGQTTWFTYASDARVKDNVREDVMGLKFILKLRPVTYNLNINSMREITGNKETEYYPEQYDVEKIKQSGFLAQEVEQAAKETGYNFSGITIPKNEKELYTMSYAQFVVPLVKAVQELNDSLNSQVQNLKSENENLKAELGNFKLKLSEIDQMKAEIENLKNSLVTSNK